MITIPTHILERKDIKSTGKLIFSVIVETPITTSSAIARRLRMNKGNVKDCVREMRKCGKIRIVALPGRKFKYEIV